jgi:hypothetical protein
MLSGGKTAKQSQIIIHMVLQNKVKCTYESTIQVWIAIAMVLQHL